MMKLFSIKCGRLSTMVSCDIRYKRWPMRSRKDRLCLCCPFDPPPSHRFPLHNCSPSRVRISDSGRNLSEAIDILQRLTGMPLAGGGPAPTRGAHQQRSVRGGTGTESPASQGLTPEARKHAYLRAAVRILGKNTPGVQATAAPQGGGIGLGSVESGGVEGTAGANDRWRDALPPSALAEVSVKLLLTELNDIVVPPRKLPRFKVHLRRAPTQEVCAFFWMFMMVWKGVIRMGQGEAGHICCCFLALCPSLPHCSHTCFPPVKVEDGVE